MYIYISINTLTTLNLFNIIVTGTSVKLRKGAEASGAQGCRGRGGDGAESEKRAPA